MGFLHSSSSERGSLNWVPLQWRWKCDWMNEAANLTNLRLVQPLKILEIMRLSLAFGVTWFTQIRPARRLASKNSNPSRTPNRKSCYKVNGPKSKKKNKSKSKVWIGILKFWPGFWEAWIWVWGFWMLGVSIQAIPSNALHFLKRFQKSYPQRSTAPWSSTGPSVGPVMVWDFPAPVPTPWAKTVNPSPYKNPQHRVGCSQQGLFGHKQKWFHWILIHRHWAQGKTRMCKR